jgi:hypothetical protein
MNSPVWSICIDNEMANCAYCDLPEKKYLLQCPNTTGHIHVPLHGFIYQREFPKKWIMLNFTLGVGIYIQTGYGKNMYTRIPGDGIPLYVSSTINDNMLLL